MIVAKYRYSPESKLFPKAHPAGWYWWFAAEGPDGGQLVGQTKGPFQTSMDAIHDAKKWGVEIKLAPIVVE